MVLEDNSGPRATFGFKRREAMTHKMILMSHDFKEVKAMVIARRKAGVSQAEVSVPRKDECGISTISACSMIDEPIERLAEID
jgi:hypothetical protein